MTNALKIELFWYWPGWPIAGALVVFVLVGAFLLRRRTQHFFLFSLAYACGPAILWCITNPSYGANNIHVRGYKEEGTITTPFDMTVLNDLDRFHLVMDTIDRLPQTGDRGIYLKQQLKDKLVEHRQYINEYGQDMPEIRNWRWKG